MMRKPTVSAYSKYFMQTHRYSSKKKKIAILRGECFEDFLIHVRHDESLDTIYRAFVIVCFCGGLRVSEGLSLKKASFYEDDGRLFADVTVLKKRREEQRTIMIHPSVADFVRNTISTIVGPLFKWNPSTCWRRMVTLFGVPSLTTHSARHSAISFYLFIAKLSREEVARLVHVSVAIIDKYAHLDEKRVLRGVFTERKAA